MARDRRCRARNPLKLNRSSGSACGYWRRGTEVHGAARTPGAGRARARTATTAGERARTASARARDASPRGSPVAQHPNGQPTVPSGSGAVLPPPGRDPEERTSDCCPSSGASSASATSRRSRDTSSKAQSASCSAFPSPATAAQRDPGAAPRPLGPHERAALEGRAAGNDCEPARLARAPAIFAGPAYGRGVLIIILWANPNPAGPLPGGVPERAP